MFSRAVGREEHCKQISLSCVGSAHSVSATLGLPLLRGVCSGSRLLCRKWALVCVHFPSLSHSSLFLGTPQMCRLAWACVLCPSQVRAAQATRCLGSKWRVCLITCLVPGTRFPGWQRGHCLRCATCLFWGADLWLWPSWHMSTVQNPRKYWLATGSLLRVL